MRTKRIVHSMGLQIVIIYPPCETILELPLNALSNHSHITKNEARHLDFAVRCGHQIDLGLFVSWYENDTSLFQPHQIPIGNETYPHVKIFEMIISCYGDNLKHPVFITHFEIIIRLPCSWIYWALSYVWNTIIILISI